MPNEITDIFIKSYAKDFQWLKNCLRSIAEKCHGFRRVIVLAPSQDLAQLASFGLTRETLIGVTEPAGNGYNIQQCYKLEADTFTDADYIMFTDSDCYFTRECSPGSFIEKDSPVIVMTEYSKLRVPWQAVVNHVMKQDVPYEFMRRHPFVYPRWLLKGFRDYIQREFRSNIWKYFIGGECPHPMSEFNLLGAFAWVFYRSKFTFLDTSKDQVPENVLYQFWSHGGAGWKDNAAGLLKYGLTL